jgi:hypothetical protein
MKPVHSDRSSIVRDLLARRKSAWLVLCVSFCLAGPTHAAETNRQTAEVVIPKSIFVSEGNIGKNPFFPNSRRLQAKAPDDSSKKPAPIDFSQSLMLKGITGPPEKRIALINNLTFAKDEEGEVKVGNGKVKIHVLEIRDKSVVVNVEGSAVPKELLLQETLLPVTK